MPKRVARFSAPVMAHERGSAARRGYGRRWQRLRRMVLAEEPLCRDLFGVHRAEGRVVAATDVYHVEPRRVRVARLARAAATRADPRKSLSAAGVIMAAIRELAGTRGGLTARELAARLELSQRSGYRLMGALLDAGFAAPAPVRSRYVSLVRIEKEPAE